MGVSETNRKAIMVQRAASQVKGNAGFMWKMFRSGKVHVVAGMIVDDLVECSYWSSVEVVKYNHVSKWEWVYVPWGWIYAV